MQTKENKMGVMPIDKLLISMSLPMMISMLVQALYNIVDSISCPGSTNMPYVLYLWHSPSRV